MAQSFIRRIKRGNLFPVWNPAIGNYDFYRKLKSGFYIKTLNPYVNNSLNDVGTHKTAEQLNTMNKKVFKDSKTSLNKKLKEEEKPGFLKKVISGAKKLFSGGGKDENFPQAGSSAFPSIT